MSCVLDPWYLCGIYTDAARSVCSNTNSRWLDKEKFRASGSASEFTFARFVELPLWEAGVS